MDSTILANDAEPSYCAANAMECVTTIGGAFSSMPEGFPLLHAVLAVLTVLQYGVFTA